jgi:ferritin
MEATMQKPAYLELLNAISNGESAAGVYLEAWADVTPNPDLACTLRLVAARERSHGDVFCRRISELGFSLEKKLDPRSAEQLAKLANPNISDLEKIGERNDGKAVTDFFADTRRKIAEGEYDPMTANLLTWYIAEEIDSGRRLKECYDCVREMAGVKTKPTMADGPSADAEAIMACMTSGFSKLEKSLDKLVKASR